jgi:hypothetical protein
MDEAGQTGENLLDAVQPVYALAGIRIEVAKAEAAVRAAVARAPKGTSELKFGSLRRSSAGRRNVLALLDDVKLASDDAAIVVLHKPWMVAAKMIDELVEPRMVAKGIQPAWYATGAAKNMAHAFYELGPPALGEAYDELTSSFVTMVRDYTAEAGTAFVRALRRCKIVCRDEQVLDLLSVMIDTTEDMEAEFASREDALDPALTALFWQGGYWSSVLETRFKVIHDDSRSVRRWQEAIFEGIQRNMADRTASESFGFGEVTIHMPTLLDTIEFEASHDDPRLQVADIVAGAAAHLYAVARVRRDDGNFVRDLRRAGVVDLIKEGVGPNPD